MGNSQAVEQLGEDCQHPPAALYDWLQDPNNETKPRLQFLVEAMA